MAWTRSDLALYLDVNEQAASRPGRFNLGETAPDIYRVSV
jgi:hypothetical protein